MKFSRTKASSRLGPRGKDIRIYFLICFHTLSRGLRIQGFLNVRQTYPLSKMITASIFVVS